MLAPTIFGLVVALLSFAAMQFVVLKHFPKFTLPCLLLVVGVGLALPLFMAEQARILYQLAWMLGMSACVFVGLTTRLFKRPGNKR